MIVVKRNSILDLFFFSPKQGDIVFFTKSKFGKNLRTQLQLSISNSLIFIQDDFGFES